MSRTGKGELLRRSKEFLGESNGLINQANALDIKYKDLLQKLQPQIKDLQDQADSLFSKPDNRQQEKPSTRSSNKVYNIKEQYENLTAKANNLRNQLKNIQNEIVELKKKAQKLNIKSEDYANKAKDSRKTRVFNFEESGIINSDEIEIFLDIFPPNIFDKVIAFEYDDSAPRGTTEWDDDKVTVKIGKNKDKQNIKETTAHEIAHIIYRDFLTDTQKGLWQTWHTQDTSSGIYLNLNAMTNTEENFAESLRYFISRPDELQKRSEERYIFMNDLINKE